jgi:predicted AAA+ superfamily ATPase
MAMYLRRKVDDFLAEWKENPNHTPLVIHGPPNIGKRESIRHFAGERYTHIVEINLAKEKKFHTIVNDGYAAEAIIKHITLLDPAKQLSEGETLIFFDELQAFPPIATALKAFCIDGRFDVICSGALTRLDAEKIESISVGYKSDYTMRSLDLEEFLWAKGYGASVVDELLVHMQELKPLSSVQMDVFGSLFFEYAVLGGMPEVIKHYLQSNTFTGSLELQRQLLTEYKEYIMTYVHGLDQKRTLKVFKAISAQLAKKNKKFTLSRLEHGARFTEYRDSIEWLVQTGMVNISYCVEHPELPLKGNYDAAKYKLYFADGGLLISMLADEVQDDLRANRNLSVCNGALYEQIVAEALVKSGYALCYYKRPDSTLEQDFFVRTMNSLVPIEVRETSTRTKALKTFIQSDSYPDISWGIKLGKDNIGLANDIYTFPYFCAFLLKRYLKDRA